MSERLIVFADRSSDPPAPSAPTYQVLALPPALLQLLTSSAASSSSSSSSASAPLEIRGDPSDSAVLVTPTQTFALRGVQNSNSLCVCSGGGQGREDWFVSPRSFAGAQEEEDEPARKRARLDDGEKQEGGRIEIEAVLHETLEAVPGVARTEKLEGLLRGCEYEGEAVEEELGMPNTRNKHTFSSLRSRLPASDAEIRLALAKQRVVTVPSPDSEEEEEGGGAEGFHRPLAPAFLLKLLPAILSTLPLPAEIAHPQAAAAKKSKPAKGAKPGASSSSTPSSEQPLFSTALDADLLDALDAVDCSSDVVARQVLGWFGEEVRGGEKDGFRKSWKVDVRAAVREVGVGVMAVGGFGQQPVEPFLDKWKALCGGFAPACDLSLLAGLHLHRPAPLSTVQYLPPSSLSPDPPARFAELFALKPKWLEVDMGLFIDDLTGGDKKKRDAMVLKFVRKVKEGGVTWWTARNLWT
ncbi:hypothetical protein JCM8097_004476 [Rhodosporidiobolus ruineniae]